MVEQMILIHLVEGSIPSPAAKQNRRWKPPTEGGLFVYSGLEIVVESVAQYKTSV